MLAKGDRHFNYNGYLKTGFRTPGLMSARIRRLLAVFQKPLFSTCTV